jgi:two-component system sensor histidine kinase/response regulator
VPKSINWLQIWTSLVGRASEFSVQNRAFNAVSVLTLSILIVILPINTYLGLQKVEQTVLVLIVLQSIFYYLSRFKKQYLISMTMYILVSYIALFINYFFNSGSLGPTLLLFLLTFNLILSFAPEKQQKYWMCTHIALVAVLLCIEYFFPSKIPDSYSNSKARLIDQFTSFAVIVLCIYFVGKYLRSNFHKERKKSNNNFQVLLNQHQVFVEQYNSLSQEFKAKETLYSKFAYEFHHSLRNITSITHSLIEAELSDIERASLRKQLMAITRTTTDMMENARLWITKHQYAPQRNAVKVLDNISEIVNRYQPFMQWRNIECRVEVPASFALMADESMLQLVLRNTVASLIKLVQANGQLTIEAYTTNYEMGVISFNARDTIIFTDEFARLVEYDFKSNSIADRDLSAGMSMYLAKEYVQAMGGKWWIEHKGPTAFAFHVSMEVAI